MILENKNLFSFSRLNRFLFIGGINDKIKFEANRFLIFGFLLSGFHCIVCINAAVKPNAQSCQKEPKEKRIFRKKT